MKAQPKTMRKSRRIKLIVGSNPARTLSPRIDREAALAISRNKTLSSIVAKNWTTKLAKLMSGSVNLKRRRRN